MQRIYSAPRRATAVLLCAISDHGDQGQERFAGGRGVERALTRSYAHPVTRTQRNALPRMALHGRRRRPLEDRLAMRFPALATRITVWFTKASLSLPRGSRLRQRLVTLATWRAFNALSRGDVDLVRTITHSEAIWDLSRWDWPEDSLYHGSDGAVLSTSTSTVSSAS